MTDEPDPKLRERARRALERSLGSVPPPDVPPDPELLARLEAALRSLPRRRREIFLAVRLDAMPYSEIAQRNGLSRQRVEREVARAVLHLHRAAPNDRPDPWWRRWVRLLAGLNRP